MPKQIIAIIVSVYSIGDMADQPSKSTATFW